MLLILSGAALAGYADVDEEGYPSWAERGTHLWTNAARVDPEAFNSDYVAAGCAFADFLADEKIAKAPLYYERQLNDSSRFHSENMRDTNFFDHYDPQGRSPTDRAVEAGYTESGVGENIAMGYGTPYNTIMGGWMCSSGHRANIMTASYTELGTGVAGSYYTQNFGSGPIDWEGPMTMGHHEPEFPQDGDTVDYYVDWYEGAAPGALEVVIDGEPYEMTLEYGEDIQGIYAVSVDLPEESGLDCHEYWFRGEDNDGNEWILPEEGSYTLGSYCDTLWVEGHELASTDDDDGGKKLGPWTLGGGNGSVAGCASTGSSPAGLALFALAGLALFVRRRS